MKYNATTVGFAILFAVLIIASAPLIRGNSSTPQDNTSELMSSYYVQNPLVQPLAITLTNTRTRGSVEIENARASPIKTAMLSIASTPEFVSPSVLNELDVQADPHLQDAIMTDTGFHGSVEIQSTRESQIKTATLTIAATSESTGPAVMNDLVVQTETRLQDATIVTAISSVPIIIPQALLADVAFTSTATVPNDAQYCAQKATYLTTPGQLPIIVEWSVDMTVSVTEVEWIFHDGTHSTASTVQFTYPNEGIFGVTLICRGDFGEIQVQGSVEVQNSTAAVSQIITVTPSLTATPGPTHTPGPTGTPTLIYTAGPSPTPRPTHTRSPSRTPGPTETAGPSPTHVPELICEIDVVADPDDLGTFQFIVTDPGSEEVFEWAIDGTTQQGSVVTVTFTEVGIKKIDLYCGSGTDRILRTIFFQVTVSSSIDVGSGMIIITNTATATPSMTLTSTVTPTFTPSITLTSTATPTLIPSVTFTPIPILTLTPTSTTVSPTDVPSITVPPAPPPTIEAPLPVVVTANPQPGDLKYCVDWLVYHTDRTGSWNLFRLGELPDGLIADMNLTRSSGPGIVSQMPSVSPDSAWMAFTSNRDGNDDIYITAVTYDDIRNITSEDVSSNVNPVWSPDNESIVFESNRDGTWDLFVLNLTSGVLSQLTHNTGNNLNAAWKPDSTQLTFQSDRSGQWQIYEIDVTSLRITNLSHDGLSEDFAPLYSHDGEFILYRSRTEGVEISALYIMKLSDQTSWRISDPLGIALNHSWAPNDYLVAYQSDLTGLNQIYVYDIRTGTTRQVTGDKATVDVVPSFAPTWLCSSSGTVVFTSIVNANTDLYSTTTRPWYDAPINVERAAKRLTDVAAQDTNPEGLRHQPSNLAREMNMQWEH